MNSKKPMSLLSATVLATSLGLGLPAIATAQQQGTPSQASQAGSRAVVGGHDVVDAVDDLRETVADFIGALIDADEGSGMGNWAQQEAKLRQMEQQLQTMEQVLDEKAEATDESWLAWLRDEDYQTTVTQQIGSLATMLEQIAGMLGDTWTTEGIQVLVGNNVLEQLGDVRETTGDLLNALSDSTADYGWPMDRTRYDQAQAKLRQMEQALDKPARYTDAQWRTYLDSPEYHVVIHDNVATLADILKNLMSKGGQSS